MKIGTARIVDALASLLDADEREAVRGDLAEAGATNVEAIRDLLGLVVRRQALRWRDWRPWLGLIGIAGLLGFLLNVVAQWYAHGSAIYAWIYVNNWTWEYLRSPGARFDLLQYSGSFFVMCLTMLCWAWAAGYALGLLSGRSVWLTGLLFGVIFFASPSGVPANAINPSNSVVFSDIGYRVVLPLAIRIVFILLPALHGISRACRRPVMHTRESLILFTIVGALTWLENTRLMMAVTFGLPQISGRFAFVRAIAQHQPHVWPWPLHLLPLAMAWPAAYLVATAIWPRSRDRGSWC